MVFIRDRILTAAYAVYCWNFALKKKYVIHIYIYIYLRFLVDR